MYSAENVVIMMSSKQLATQQNFSASSDCLITDSCITLNGRFFLFISKYMCTICVYVHSADHKA